MFIAPTAHGKHNNIHLKAKAKGYVFRMVAFFDSGDTWIIRSGRTPKSTNPVDLDALYEDLKWSLMEHDFVLKTPRKKFTNIKLGNTTKLLNHLKDINYDFKG